MKKLVARCELQNQLDPIFANLTWPVVGAGFLVLVHDPFEKCCAVINIERVSLTAHI